MEPYILYDGECPFCSAYVKFMRLRESVGPVQLIDARDGGTAVDAARTAGFDLNEGMIFRYGGRYYYGADAIQMLSLMSGNSGWLNRLNASLFRSPARANVLYPFLRAGRMVTLRLLGRSKLQN
ncbi:MAG: thiol-disulfide oxidoreductase DCC family protein [Sphingobium sp.]